MKAQQKKLSGCAYNLLAHEDLGHFRKPIVGIYKPSSIMKIPTSLREGPFFYLCNFYFEFESPSSLIKHQLRGTMIVFEHFV